MNYNYRDNPGNDHRLSRPLDAKRKRIIIEITEFARDIRHQAINIASKKREVYGLSLDHEKEGGNIDNYLNRYAKKLAELNYNILKSVDEIITHTHKNI